MMVRFPFTTTVLLLFLLFSIVVVVLGQEQQPCIGYSKGAFSGNVTAAEICRAACQTAEGLCCPDFKQSSGTNITFYECQCKNQESGSSSNRNLCRDEGFGSSTSSGGGGGGASLLWGFGYNSAGVIMGASMALSEMY